MKAKELELYLDYFVTELILHIRYKKSEFDLKSILESFYSDKIFEEIKQIITETYRKEYAEYVYSKSVQLNLNMLEPSAIWKNTYRKNKIKINENI